MTDKLRPETTSEHIARDMREGRFPEQSERQMVAVDEPGKPADVTGDLIRRADALKAIDPGDGDFHMGNYMAIAALAAVQVGVKAGEIERAIWSAMIWAASNNPAFNDLPEYTDRGNSFAEDECRRASARIRSALIPTPAPSPDVPTPPDGWNVMKLGQVGWHVVQSANGWETSRIFGAECLLRSGGGDEFGPALDATPDGGRVAADAPTPSPDVGALEKSMNDAIVAMRCASAVVVSKHELARLTDAVTGLRAALAKMKGGAE